MNERDVPRWADSEDELPEELRVWLRGGGAALGSAGEVAELRQRLVAALGPAAGLGGGEPPSGEPVSGEQPSGERPGGASSPGAPPATSAVALGQRLGRWGWVGLGGVGIAIGVWVYGGRAPAPVAIPNAAPSAVTAPAPRPSAEVATGSEPSSAAPEAAVPAAQPPPPDLAPQRPLGTASTTPRERRASRARPSSPPSLGEAALLERARNALRENPAAALALTRDHDRRFPRGVLAEESEVIAIEALRRMGREQAASRRAAEFERRYRGSVHRQRLEGPAGAPR